MKNLKNLKFLLCAVLIGMSGAASAETYYHPDTQWGPDANGKIGCGSTWWVEQHSMYWENGTMHHGQTISYSTGQSSVYLYCDNGTIHNWTQPGYGSLWLM